MAPAKAQAIKSPDPTYFLAIVSGGSGTRLALADASGRVLRQEHCGSTSPHFRRPASFTNTLVHALSRVLASDAPRVHAAGMAGPADHTQVRGALDHLLPNLPVFEFSDGDLARGLHGMTTGVALVVGTGCNCSAVNERGMLTTLGGYGPQFGDEGSSYWIGREGLRAAFQAEQKRGAPTMLLDSVRRFYEIKSPWNILMEAEGSGYVPAPRVAAFAREVDRMAEAGDERAAAILEEAGKHLGSLIVETAQQARFALAPVPLAMSGGALRSTRVRTAIERYLAVSNVDFLVHPVVHEPIAGLITLLRRANETERA